LRISEVHGRVRLGVDCFGDVREPACRRPATRSSPGSSEIALAFRNGAIGPLSTECGIDHRLLEFIWRIGDVAASGGEPRELLFGPNPLAA
jgi:hypothetical protein